MQSHLVTLLATALLAVIGSSSALADGCGIPGYVGRSGEYLHYFILQSSKPARFIIGEDCDGRAVPIAKGELFPRAGNGSRAWSATRSGDVIEIAELTGFGERTPAGSLKVPFLVTSFSWAEDKGGAAWLFFGGMRGDRRGVNAYRLVNGAWVCEGGVEEDLRTPRLDRATGLLIMGPWSFAAGKAPEALSPPSGLAPREFLEWFAADGQVLVTTSKKNVWSSADRGVTWTRIDAPAFTEIAWSDDGGPVVVWSDRTTKRVSRWRAGKWTTLAELERRTTDLDVGGPIVVVGDSVHFVGGCYRFEGDREWITRTVHSPRGTTSTKVTLVR